MTRFVRLCHLSSLPERSDDSHDGTRDAPTRRATLALLGLVLATRGPFFFNYELNWDESTFVVVGDAVARGQLPYLDYWENKPPLLFGFFALVVLVGGVRLEAVRVAGALCVLGAALLLRRITHRVVDARAGDFAAGLLVVALAVAGGGQATMSEQVALVPLLGGIDRLSGPARQRTRLLGAGALFAAAALVRLNLAVAFLAAAAWLALGRRSSESRRQSRDLLDFLLGGAVVVALTALPFVAAGEAGLLWRSAVLAPMAYSEARSGDLEAVWRVVRHEFGGFRWGDGRIATGFAVWLGGLVGWLALARRKPVAPAAQRSSLVLLVGVGGSVAASIAASGSREHYLMQVLPFFCFAAGALAVSMSRSRAGRLAAGALLLAAAVSPLWRSAEEAGRLAARVRAGAGWSRGVVLDVAAELRRRCPQGCTAYLLHDQLAYALLGIRPPVRMVTHPSNLAREYFLRALDGPQATSEGEMQKIVLLRPRFVVRKERVGYLEGTAAESVLDRALERQYAVVGTIGDRNVYELR